MMKWIAVVVVSVTVLGSAYMFGLAWSDFLTQSQRVREVKNKVAQVEAAKRTKAAQITEVAVWNQLWDEVRASRFDPGKWVSTPVNLSRDMYWTDFNEVMLLVSNANTLEAGYWFRPQALRVVKAPPQLQTGRSGEGGEPAPMPKPINAHVSGEFLRMKDS